MIKKLIVLVLIGLLAIHYTKGALIAPSSDINNEELIKVFINAAFTGKKNKVEEMLNAGMPVNSKGPGGQTALQRAASQTHSEVVDLLLKRGADANSADKQKTTPLIAVVMSYPSTRNLPALTEIVRLLITQGVQINAQNAGGQTALIIAAATRLDSIVQMLLDAGADIWIKDSLLNKRAIDLADENSIEGVKQDYAKAQVEIEQDRLAGGKNTLALESKRDYWMHEMKAVERIKELMLSKEKSIKEFMEAVFTGNTNKVEAMLNAGMFIHTKDPNGLTALHHAARQGHSELVKLLLQRGADIEGKDTKGFTALHHAASQAHTEMVDLLLQKGANASSVDKENATPLMAVILSYPKTKDLPSVTKIVQAFIAREVDVNTQNNSSQTALILATSVGLDTIVEILLGVGADVELKDGLNRKAIDWARAVQNSNVEALLLKTDKKTQETKAVLHKQELQRKEAERLKAEEAQRQEALRLKQEEEVRKLEAERLKAEEIQHQEALRRQQEEEAARRQIEELANRRRQEEARHQEELRRQEVLLREKEEVRRLAELRRQEEARRQEALRREAEEQRKAEELEQARRQEEERRGLPGALNGLMQSLTELRNALQVSQPLGGLQIDEPLVRGHD